MTSTRPHWTVDEGSEGVRLDVALARWLGEPRAQVQRRFAEQKVLVDGQVASKSHRLGRGEQVEVLEAEPRPVPAPPPVPIRYEDDHLVVVAKPAGLVVHPGAGARPEPTLVEALRASGVTPVGGADLQRPGIVHRLDRGTSGLLVVAKTPAAYRGLVELFSGRSVDRAYWALVQGVPDPPRATIDAPIARSTTRRTRFAVDPAGRPSVSHYDVVEAFGEAAALEVRLETGRTHQVRVHLASVGHPVVADAAYGASPELGRRLELARPALHARALRFDHPVTAGTVEVTEPLPEDLERAVGMLRAGGQVR